MTEEEAVKLLRGGRDGVLEWNRRREAGEPVPRLAKAALRDAKLGGVNLAGVELQEANLYGAYLGHANLIGAHLSRAQLGSANLSEANLTAATLLEARLKDAVLGSANLTKARLRDAILVGAALTNAKLVKADLARANMTRANLRGADCTKARFLDANLTSARVDGAKLSGANLHRIRFKREHESLYDGSDSITSFWWDRWFGWSRLRKLGDVPLFGVSWGAFILALGTINAIGALNETRFIDVIHYPVRIPHRMMLILLDTVLLVIGSSFYKWFCPGRVQEFSETQWVEQHGRPRLQYFAEDWKHRRRRVVAWVATVTGAVLGAFLVLERLYLGVKYIGAELGWWP
jgi:uncharacterized protein YjbI with pentapeptide repeats